MTFAFSRIFTQVQMTGIFEYQALEKPSSPVGIQRLASRFLPPSLSSFVSLLSQDPLQQAGHKLKNIHIYVNSRVRRRIDSVIHICTDSVMSVSVFTVFLNRLKFRRSTVQAYQFADGQRNVSQPTVAMHRPGCVDPLFARKALELHRDTRRVRPSPRLFDRRAKRHPSRDSPLHPGAPQAKQRFAGSPSYCLGYSNNKSGVSGTFAEAFEAGADYYSASEEDSVDEEACSVVTDGSEDYPRIGVHTSGRPAMGRLLETYPTSMPSSSLGNPFKQRSGPRSLEDVISLAAIPEDGEFPSPASPYDASREYMWA